MVNLYGIFTKNLQLWVFKMEINNKSISLQELIKEYRSNYSDEPNEKLLLEHVKMLEYFPWYKEYLLKNN